MLCESSHFETGSSMRSKFPVCLGSAKFGYCQGPSFGDLSVSPSCRYFSQGQQSAHFSSSKDASKRHIVHYVSIVCPLFLSLVVAFKDSNRQRLYACFLLSLATSLRRLQVHNPWCKRKWGALPCSHPW